MLSECRLNPCKTGGSNVFKLIDKDIIVLAEHGLLPWVLAGWYIREEKLRHTFFWCSAAYLWVVYQVFLAWMPAESDRQIISLLIFQSYYQSILNPKILSLAVLDIFWNFVFYLFLSAVFFHVSTYTCLFETTISKSFGFLPRFS